MHNQRTSYIYAILAVLLWSTVATAFKITLALISPVKLLFFSSFISLLFLTILLVYQKKLSEAFRYLVKNITLVIILGLINPFLYYLTLFRAYDILPAQEAQAINYTWALTLSYLSVIFLKHRLSKYDIFGGVLAYIGVLIIATKGEIFSLNFSDPKGVELALLSTILWSFYWIFNTKSKTNPTITLFCNFFVGTAFIIVYIVYNNINLSISPKAFLGASYIGLFEMGITFLLWLKALKLTKNTSKIANLIFLSPFLSLIFIHFIAKEEIENSTIIALAFILSGLLLQKVHLKKLKANDKDI